MRTSKQARRKAAQLFRYCQGNGSLDEKRVRQLVQRLIAAGYRESPAILAHLIRLVRLDRDRHTARIETAAPLQDDLRARLEANLARVYGRGLITAFAHEPSLIGGMRIRVGSDVYDGSVLGRLTALESSF
jgi:F-type H+-transporting ATPase subunit delta